jgi:hypothetical protein
MKRFFILILFLFSSIGYSQVSTKFLVEACKSKSLDERVFDFCAGYMAGFFHGFGIGTSETFEMKVVPNTTEQMIELYVAWYEDETKKMSHVQKIKFDNKPCIDSILSFYAAQRFFIPIKK